MVTSLTQPSGAVFDTTGAYRYRLHRTWEQRGKRVVFVLLNPSTADAETNDPTIRRCIGFARDWGFGSMVVVNLFGFRATRPDDLFKARDPIGPDNDRWLRREIRRAHRVVMGWGAHSGIEDRAAAATGRNPGPWTCLGTTKDGHPRHPLYMRKDAVPLPYRDARTIRITEALARHYPRVETDLVHRNTWELLVATVLSAQTTDKQVNRVTPGLFARWSTPDALAGAPRQEVEKAISSVNYFRQKARSICETSGTLVDKWNGEVPRTMEELVLLRGVGRKTASVVLAVGHGVPALAVDTHVQRVSRRLGLTSEKDPSRIEAELTSLLPPRDWEGLSIRMIRHGRALCDARHPLCRQCFLRSDCPASDR